MVSNTEDFHSIASWKDWVCPGGRCWDHWTCSPWVCRGYTHEEIGHRQISSTGAQAPDERHPSAYEHKGMTGYQDSDSRSGLPATKLHFTTEIYKVRGNEPGKNTCLHTQHCDYWCPGHQAISKHSVDKIFTVFDQFHTRILHIQWKSLEN